MRSEKLRVNRKKYKFSEFEGITLISLVITIIILIILAGVGINLSLGENGIFKRAKEARDKYNNEVSNEKNALEDIYSQILVAEDSKVTLTMEQLDNYINEKIEEKMTKVCLDSNRLIKNIANSRNTEMEITYTAEEDCAIAGTIMTYNGGYVNVYINGVGITEQYSSSGQINCPIYCYLKKGDTIKFGRCNMNGGTWISINAFGIK